MSIKPQHLEPFDRQWLIKEIESSGLSKYAIGELSGVSRRCLGDYLAGKQNLRQDKLKLIIEALRHHAITKKPNR